MTEMATDPPEGRREEEEEEDPKTPPPPPQPRDEVEEKIDEAGEESFPASDPPAWTPAAA